MIRGSNRHCVIKVEFDEQVKVGFFVRVMERLSASGLVSETWRANRG
jgi:hypothetical protein